jgi:hypothetical protein
MTKQLTGPALVAYLRQFPTSDDRQWAADEIERLREALTECLRVNETDAVDDVKVWAKAMLDARAALAQGEV